MVFSLDFFLQQLEDIVKPIDAKMSKSEDIKPFPPTYDDDFVAITSATNQDPKIVPKKLDDENVCRHFY
jgi:hypothetical protein